MDLALVISAAVALAGVVLALTFVPGRSTTRQVVERQDLAVSWRTTKRCPDQLHSQDQEFPPGRLADANRGDTSDPGYPQPHAAEVESARLLANDAPQALLAAGLSDEDIDRLADDFIADDRGEATERSIDWATRVRRTAALHAAGVDAPRRRAADARSGDPLLSPSAATILVRSSRSPSAWRAMARSWLRAVGCPCS
jgi:hypothetical protein